MAQPAKRLTGEIGKTHQRTQGPITGKPKKRAGREWYNPTIKNRTQMNADYLGKNEPVNPRKSVSRQKTENRAKKKPADEGRGFSQKVRNQMGLYFLWRYRSCTHLKSGFLAVPPGQKKLFFPAAESRAALSVPLSTHLRFAAWPSAKLNELSLPCATANGSTQPVGTLITQVPRFSLRGSCSSTNTIDMAALRISVIFVKNGCGPPVTLDPCHPPPFIGFALE